MRIRTGLLLLVFGGDDLSRLFAQGTTATILGSVTDSTRAVITEGMIQVTNTGTGERRTAATDAAGRYRVPDLAVGSYDAEASKEGFATVIRRGITLTVGRENVVDFTLPVGQTQSTVIVQGNVTQVETANAAVGALIDQRQMRELPLNGRNFEQLIQLASGVQNYYAGTQGLNMREGKDAAISVAGSRPEGIALLMDDQNLQTFYNRGLG